MKKKLTWLAVLAVLLGMFFVVSGKDAISVQAAENVVQLPGIWAEESGVQPIADYDIKTPLGYVWAVKKDNGRYYVYYSKVQGGKGRYLFQTQPDVAPGGVVFTDSYVYFTQDSADGLKHYAYQVNLSGTRKMTRLFGFKSKTAAKSSILNYYEGRIYYYYEDKETMAGNFYRYDTTTKTKKGCKANIEFKETSGQYIYVKDADAETLGIYDCSKNKFSRKLNAPSGFTFDFIGPMQVGDDIKLFLIYRQNNFENSKMMVTLKAYLANINGSTPKPFAEFTGENAQFVLAMEDGVLFVVDESTADGGTTSHYEYVTSKGTTRYESISDFFAWLEEQG